jgi:hypothetical protein
VAAGGQEDHRRQQESDEGEAHGDRVPRRVAGETPD